MAQVSVSINGRQFRIACDDGQEESLTALATSLDQRIEAMRGSFGEIGDTRLTVMAAIQVADELRDAEQRIRRLEEEVTAMQDARVLSTDRARQAQAAVVHAFNSAAERIEGITKRLNQTAGDDVSIG
ncbi:MAG: cell division protein ZapA [Rhizobiales bacterium]|nr:cell division protein ZapA [Hyphomicrobiales bacterium]OJY40760.1 MAG: cell division protein ZapA [Rhizobiales bacterium 64-17]